MPATAIVEPTLRSISPMRMSRVSPTATIATSLTRVRVMPYDSIASGWSTSAAAATRTSRTMALKEGRAATAPNRGVVT